MKEERGKTDSLLQFTHPTPFLHFSSLHILLITHCLFYPL